MPKCSECNVKFEEEEELRNHLEKDHDLPRDFFKQEEGVDPLSIVDRAAVKDEFSSSIPDTEKEEISVKEEVKDDDEYEGYEDDELDDNDTNQDQTEVDGDNLLKKCRHCDLEFPIADIHRMKRHVTQVHQTVAMLRAGDKAVPIQRSEDRLWRCPCCDIAPFELVRGLHFHFKNTHADKMTIMTEEGEIEVSKSGDSWKCPADTCTKTYKALYDIQHHYSGFHSTKLFPCSQCPATFQVITDRTLHVQVHHQTSTLLTNTEGEERVDKIDGAWPCTKCPRTFEKVFHLQRHYRRHPGRRLVGVSFTIRGQDDEIQDTLACKETVTNETEKRLASDGNQSEKDSRETTFKRRKTRFKLSTKFKT